MISFLFNFLINNVKQTNESDECFDFMIYLTYAVFNLIWEHFTTS